MAVVKNLLVRAGADFSELQKEMQKAEKFMKSAGKQITDIGKTLTVGITTPLLGLGTISVKTAADFQESMSKVSAISGATGDDLARLTDMAKHMGQLLSSLHQNLQKHFNTWPWPDGKLKIC